MMNKLTKLFAVTIAIVLIFCMCAAYAEGTDLKAGDEVVFGRYEQDGDISNGPEPIEWIVMDCDVDKGEALLVSKYGLDSKTYHHETPYPTWENSDIRKWLNEDFIDAAFTPDEQAALLITVNETGDNYYWGSLWKIGFEKFPGGNDTEDKVFLLGIEEILEATEIGTLREFWENDWNILVTSPTEYAVANGAFRSNRGKCWWWMRDPGFNSGSASRVMEDGELGVYYVNLEGCCVRPAIRIDTSAL